jgi:ABC-type transport system involved in multi-copper enzyme maturation permease subunit
VLIAGGCFFAVPFVIFVPIQLIGSFVDWRVAAETWGKCFVFASTMGLMLSQLMVGGLGANAFPFERSNRSDETILAPAASREKMAVSKFLVAATAASTLWALHLVVVEVSLSFTVIASCVPTNKNAEPASAWSSSVLVRLVVSTLPRSRVSWTWRRSRFPGGFGLS